MILVAKHVLRCDLEDDYSGTVHAGHVLDDPVEFDGGTATVDSEDDAQAVARRHMHLHYDGVADDGDDLPFDPSSMTVSELRRRLEESDLSTGEVAALREAEQDGKNRETALDVIGGY